MAEVAKVYQPEPKPESDSDTEYESGPESEPEESYPFSDSEYEDESKRHLTREEWAIYAKQVKESDGFKVDDVSRCEFGLIFPEYFDPTNEEDKLVLYTKTAIAEFNNTPHKVWFENSIKNIEGELEYDKLLMATSQGCAGVMYYLTFKAKNLKKGGESITYQAIVWERIQKSMKVLSFRLQPSGSTKTWFFQKHQCGCSGDDSTDDSSDDANDD